jgi:hypothetical protein
MQRIVTDEFGHNLQATDGELGHVTDFLFDDSSWTIRYLVAKTGTWLFGRNVLISRTALVQHAWESGIFPVNLTKEQIRNSPDVNTIEPVSRKQEAELAAYYSWEPYWGTGFLPGEPQGIIPATPILDPGAIIDQDTMSHPEASDGDASGANAHLHSCRETRSFRIEATGGEIGHVDDFLMDDQTWQISHLVVAAHHGLAEKKVLIAINYIRSVDWQGSTITVDLDIDAIKNGKAISEWDYIIPEG